MKDFTQIPTVIWSRFTLNLEPRMSPIVPGIRIRFKTNINRLRKGHYELLTRNSNTARYYTYLLILLNGEIWAKKTGNLVFTFRKITKRQRPLIWTLRRIKYFRTWENCTEFDQLNLFLLELPLSWVTTMREISRSSNWTISCDTNTMYNKAWNEVKQRKRISFPSNQLLYELWNIEWLQVNVNRRNQTTFRRRPTSTSQKTSLICCPSVDCSCLVFVVLPLSQFLG